MGRAVDNAAAKIKARAEHRLGEVLAETGAAPRPKPTR
jgi:hypothetical protein